MTSPARSELFDQHLNHCLMSEALAGCHEREARFDLPKFPCRQTQQAFYTHIGG